MASRTFRKQPAARYGIPAHAFCIVAFPGNLHGKETVQKAAVVWYGIPARAFCIVACPSNLHGKETVTLILVLRTFKQQPAARYGTPHQITHFVLLHFQATCTVRKLSRSFRFFVLSESSLLHGTDYHHTHFELSDFQATCTVRKMSHSFWLFVLSESSLLHGTEYRHTRFCIVAFPSNLRGKETVTLIVAFRTFRKQPAAQNGIPAHAFYVVGFATNLHGKGTVTHIVAFHYFRKQGIPVHTFCIVAFLSNLHGKELSHSFSFWIFQKPACCGVRNSSTRILYCRIFNQPVR